MSSGQASVTFVTIVTRNYAHQLLLWAQMIRRHHPDARLRVYLVDDGVPALRPQAQMLNMELVLAESLGVPLWHVMLFKYDAVGIACALRPWAILDTQQAHGGKIIYLDCDIGTFAPASEMLDLLDRHPMVLTPHCVVPPPDDGRGPDPMILRLVGYFNSGVIGVQGESSRRFFEWQKSVLENQCIVSPSSGILLDQAYTVQALGMVQGVAILSTPGYNVGHWNLHEQDVTRQPSGIWWANERPLVFFHFSGLRLTPKYVGLSMHQNRIAPGDRPELDRLCNEYLQAWRVAAETLGTLPDYTYLVLSDGTPIRREWREAVRLNLVGAEGGGCFDERNLPSYRAVESHPLVTGERWQPDVGSNREWHLQWLQRAATSAQGTSRSRGAGPWARLRAWLRGRSR